MDGKVTEEILDIGDFVGFEEETLDALNLILFSDGVILVIRSHQTHAEDGKN